MTLSEKIIAIYPELAEFNFASGVIDLFVRGNVETIETWNHSTLARPTQEQLDSVGGA
jgi:hypothetical protein